MGANRFPARFRPFHSGFSLRCRSLNSFPVTIPLSPSPSRFMSTTVSLDAATAFAAIALAAVSWDGTLTMAGSRALRHSLDYRQPFQHYGDEKMVQMMNTLLAELRHKGPQHLMVEAAEALDQAQRSTAYAVAAEIMRSDGPLEADERNILANLATTLNLSADETNQVLAVMELLHADVLS
jgi:tellurite resistance protein